MSSLYVSTAGISGATIKERVEQLALAGFTQIELSGGSRYYPDIQADLLSLQEQYSLQYLIHNYFPPPQQDFVFNLASLNPTVYQQSQQLAETAISLAQTLNVPKIGFHAGFLIDIPNTEIGQSIHAQPLFDRTQALEQFNQALTELESKADSIELYIENNVLSAQNYQNFNQTNPFFLVTAEDLNEFKPTMLLDVAHLYVSCQTLGLDFGVQLQTLITQTDYLHLSSNDGKSDSNQNLHFDGEIWTTLTNFKPLLKSKTITLEINAPLPEIRTTYDRLAKELND